MEEWKAVPGTNNKIEVSNMGRVRSWLRGDGRILKTQKDRKGYHRLRVTIDRQKMSFKLHRIVAGAFIDNPDHLPQVNHIDGNKDNNAVSNLEWVTNQQNVIHSFAMANGEFTSVKDMTYIPTRMTINGKKVYLKSRLSNGHKKLCKSNEERRREIIATKDGERMDFRSISDAERYFNSRHICAVLKGKRSHVKGWSFSYKEGGDVHDYPRSRSTE